LRAIFAYGNAHGNGVQISQVLSSPLENTSTEPFSANLLTRFKAQSGQSSAKLGAAHVA
jgi:hypothetical protein